MSKNIEFRSIIEAEIPRQSLPPRARARVEETYRLLGAQRPVSKRRFRRAWIVSVSSVAACFLLLFSTNAAFPVFAEGLPVVGKFFQTINRHDGFKETIPQGKTIQGSNIGNLAQTINATSQSGGYTMAVEKAFSDGQSLTLSLRMDIPEETSSRIDYALSENMTVSVNGEAAQLVDGSLSALFPSAEGGFAGAVNYTLPQSVEDGAPLDVEISMSDFGGKDKKEKDYNPCIPMDAAFDISFSMTADTSWNRAFSCETEDNGAKLLYVDSTPVRTRLTVVKPYWGDGENGAQGEPALYLEDGTRLDFNLRYSIGHDYDPWGEEKVEQTADIYFDGIPSDSEKAVFRFYRDASSMDEVLAEFTIDLANGTAAPSATYTEEGPLVLNSPFDYRYLDTGDYEGYSENKAVNGFVISDLSYSSTDARFTVGLYKTYGDYREVRVEILNAQGAVVASDVSEYNTAVSDTKTYWDMTSPNWDVYAEVHGKDKAPNLYKISTASNYQPACGETLTVRVTDNKTDEVLVTRDITMNVKFY